MKDIAHPASYGSVYVPPHHRLRSVITSATAPDISVTPHAVVDNSNSVVNSSHNISNYRLTNPYPYLPPHQLHHNKKSSTNGVSPDREFDFSIQSKVVSDRTRKNSRNRSKITASQDTLNCHRLAGGIVIDY